MLRSLCSKVAQAARASRSAVGAAAAVRSAPAAAPRLGALGRRGRAVAAAVALAGGAAEASSSSSPASSDESKLNNDELQELHSAYGMLALLVLGPRYGQSNIAAQANDLRLAFQAAAGGSDTMDADAFCDFVGQKLGAPLSEAERSTWLRALQSADGRVSQQEFAQGFLLIRGMGAQHAVRQLPLHFAAIDADRDGKANRDELRRWLRLAVRTDYLSTLPRPAAAAAAEPLDCLLTAHGVAQESLSLGEFQAIFHGLVQENKALASTR